MTNLLPPAAKKQIVFEYWTRVICAWVIFWAVCLLVGALLLLPTYVLLTGNNAARAESMATATERTYEYESISLELSQASRQAQEIIVTTNRPLLSEILFAVRGAVLPGQITLSQIGIERPETGIETLSVGGSASDRQALADFRDRLESLPFVSSVELPIANLAQNANIQFSLSVTINEADL